MQFDRKMTSVPREVPILSAPTTRTDERRRSRERRHRTLRALMVGSFHARRRRVRRSEAGGLAAIDWYPAQCLALVMLTLLLSCADSLNTLALLSRGFIEANPLMNVLITRDASSFALIKFGLTATSLITLIVLIRARLFGRIPVAFILYGCVTVYMVLVSYEFWMLHGFTLFD
jgi:hypothetical protein